MPNGTGLVDIGRVVSRPAAGHVRTCRPRTLIAVGLIVLLQPIASSGEEEAVPEYELKAAFLFRLPAFVNWPEESRRSTPIKLCIVGPDPFGANLDFLEKKLAEDPRISEASRIVVVRIEPSADTTSCSVVFLGAMERATSASVLRSIAGRAILTVSEADGFAKRGGMIRFLTKGRSVGFEINRTAVRAGGLRLDATLLKIAKVIY